MIQKLQEIRENKRPGDGFTIIEVMIVLAIAGLILVVALIAIPQLQRNQRNNARQSIMSRIATEVGNYSGNNNGRVMTSDAEVTSFETRYLSGVDISDPSTGVAFNVTWIDTPTVVSGTNVPTDGAEGVANYADGYECDGEQVVAGSARTFALYTVLEGGAIYCLDNQ